MQSIEHVSFGLIDGKIADLRSLGGVASKLLDAGEIIPHIYPLAKASMPCRLFNDLDVGTEARPVKPQEPPGQLTQIVTGGPNRELARPSKGICRMDDQRRFRSSVAHFGDCRPGERSQSAIWQAVSACLARRRSTC
jgi:hypothetical protein